VPSYSGEVGLKAAQAKPLAAASGEAGSSGVRWLQRLGVAGFAFFLIKGLLWLAVPALLAYLGNR
jgi:hypothetical protein